MTQFENRAGYSSGHALDYGAKMAMADPSTSRESTVARELQITLNLIDQIERDLENLANRLGPISVPRPLPGNPTEVRSQVEPVKAPIVDMLCAHQQRLSEILHRIAMLTNGLEI